MMLLDSLKGCNNLKELDLSRSCIDDNCMEALGQLIKNNDKLEKLYLKKNRGITSEGIEKIAPYIKGNTSLKCFDVEGCKAIKNKSLPLIVSIITNSRIENIVGEYTSIKNVNPIVIAAIKNKLLNKTDTLYFYHR